MPVEIRLGGTVPDSAQRARRLGDAWLTGQNATDGDLRRQLDLYRDAAARAGRSARPVLRRDVYVGASDDEARAVVGAIQAEGYRGTASTSSWWAAPPPSSRRSAATGRWASTP